MFDVRRTPISMRESVCGFLVLRLRHAPRRWRRLDLVRFTARSGGTGRLPTEHVLALMPVRDACPGPTRTPPGHPP